MSPTMKALLCVTVGLVLWALYDDPRCVHWLRRRFKRKVSLGNPHPSCERMPDESRVEQRSRP